MARASGWLRRPAPRPGARVDLVCFPHAGGGASAFRGWLPLLPPEVELTCVQYPGREDRFGEPPAPDMPELVRQVCDDLGAPPRPYVLLGHSMGAAAAYEVAQEQRRRGHPAPERLVACGRHSPLVRREGHVHRSDDAALSAELLRLGGTPPEVLADPDLSRAVLDVVRADYRVAETYTASTTTPLTCPVSALVGDADPECTPEDARAWRATTTAPTVVTVFPGDHFFLVPRRREVVAAVLRAIGPGLVPETSPWPSTP